MMLLAVRGGRLRGTPNALFIDQVKVRHQALPGTKVHAELKRTCTVGGIDGQRSMGDHTRRENAYFVVFLNA